MRPSTSSLALLALSAGTTSAFAIDDPWALLDQITIDEQVSADSYVVKKTFPLAIQNGVKEFRITGYAMPLTPGNQVRDLILVADMGNCPFCGSPDHGATLQVELDNPIQIEEGQRISVVGALEPVTDPETWQSAILRGASLTDL